jgi:hypothetical protein
MPPSVNITTTTNQFLAPKWVDQVLRDNAFFGHILSKTEKWKGSQMLFPIKYQKGIASVAFNGYDLLPITQQPVSVNMTFFPTFVATNVALAGSDLSINKAEGNGALKAIDLMSVMMESRAQDAADDIGNFFQGDGTSFGGKAPAGLLNIVDNGTVAAIYGGLSRAAYPGLNATVTASGGTISLLKTRQLWNAISDGPVKPDTIITDYTTWAYFEQLLTSFQRNTMTSFEAGKSVNSSASGYADLIWDGMKIYRDKKITTGYFYMLNTEYLKFYGLNWYEGTKVSPRAKDIEGNVYEDSFYSPGNAFTWTGWINAYNMGAINGFMIFGGQLICTDPFRNGVLTGVTGI